jgi:hypothetical protein
MKNMDLFAQSARTLFGVFIVVLLFTASPQRAHAQFAVVDVVNWIENAGSYIKEAGSYLLTGEMTTKEFALDPLAYMAAEAVRQSLVQSMVNWASSGFDGSPAFVTDLQENLLIVADTVIADFRRQLTLNRSLRSPFSTRVGNAVIDNYYRTTGPLEDRAKYTLRDFCPNDEAFLKGDFSSCGLRGWLGAWSNEANNPRGASQLLGSELSYRISEALDARRTELDQGNGFLSMRVCKTVQVGASCTNGDPDCYGGQGGEGVSLTKTDPKQSCSVATPGSIIHDQLDDTLGSGVAKLVSADEINELIGSAISNLVNDVLSKGLARGSSSGGVSRPRPSDPVSLSITGALNAAIGQSVQKVQEFGGSWSTIRSVAQAAKEKLESCSSAQTSSLAASVFGVITESDSQTARATQSLAALSKIQSDVRSIRTQEDLQRVSTSYQDLVSNTLPRATDIIYASEQSKDAPSGAPATLYSSMASIVQMNCSIMFN